MRPRRAPSCGAVIWRTRARADKPITHETPDGITHGKRVTRGRCSTPLPQRIQTDEGRVTTGMVAPQLKRTCT
eukprot:14518853-Heterocapsa_arctica.AAC.1